jgi:hypothetical protein
MEACSSAHYWARRLGGFGHTPRLMAAEFVKPGHKKYKGGNADTARKAGALYRERPVARLRIESETVPRDAPSHAHEGLDSVAAGSRGESATLGSARPSEAVAPLTAASQIGNSRSAKQPISAGACLVVRRPLQMSENALDQRRDPRCSQSP